MPDHSHFAQTPFNSVQNRSKPFKLRSTPFKLRSTLFKLRSKPFKLRSTPFKLRSKPFKVRSTPFNSVHGDLWVILSPGETLRPPMTHHMSTTYNLWATLVGIMVIMHNLTRQRLINQTRGRGGQGGHDANNAEIFHRKLPKYTCGGMQAVELLDFWNIEQRNHDKHNQ